jgi:hypothetical protein
VPKVLVEQPKIRFERRTRPELGKGFCPQVTDAYGPAMFGGVGVDLTRREPEWDGSESKMRVSLKEGLTLGPFLGGSCKKRDGGSDLR